MLREKLFGTHLASNKPIILRKVAFEKLSEFQIDLTRKVVNIYLGRKYNYTLIFARKKYYRMPFTAWKKEKFAAMKFFREINLDH